MRENDRARRENDVQRVRRAATLEADPFNLDAQRQMELEIQQCNVCLVVKPLF